MPMVRIHSGTPKRTSCPLFCRPRTLPLPSKPPATNILPARFFARMNAAFFKTRSHFARCLFFRCKKYRNRAGQSGAGVFYLKKIAFSTKILSKPLTWIKSMLSLRELPLALFRRQSQLSRQSYIPLSLASSGAPSKLTFELKWKVKENSYLSTESISSSISSPLMSTLSSPSV